MIRSGLNLPVWFNFDAGAMADQRANEATKRARVPVCPEKHAKRSSRGDAPEVIAHDLACIRCGYNLRSLDRHGMCPECGSSIAPSLRADLLRFADERWLGRITLGLRLIYASMAGLLLGMVVLIAGWMLDEATLPSTAWAALLLHGQTALLVLVHVMWPVCFGVGWWFATTADPAEPENAGGVRLAMRTAALLVVPAGLGWIFVHRFTVVPLPSLYAVELQSLAGFLVVWAYVWLLVRMFGILGRRCSFESVSDAKRFERQRVRLRIYAIAVPALVLALHLGAIVMTSTGRLPQVFRGRPIGFGTGVGWVLMALLWLACTAGVRPLLRAVLNERAARGEGADGDGS